MNSHIIVLEIQTYSNSQQLSEDCLEIYRWTNNSTLQVEKPSSMCKLSKIWIIIMKRGKKYFWWGDYIMVNVLKFNSRWIGLQYAKVQEWKDCIVRIQNPGSHKKQRPSCFLLKNNSTMGYLENLLLR
jgi:hypothetical protein